MLQLSQAAMDKIVFTDEKWFDSQTKRNVKLWARTPAGLPSRWVDQGAARCLVWGAVSLTSKRLHFVDATSIDADEYAKIIAANSDVLRGRVLQQDNAKPHTKLERSGYFARRRIGLLGWPPLSPDLNVIETLWGLLAKEVQDRGAFGVDELRKFVRDEFEKVSQETIAGLVGEFRLRCQACVRAGGGLVTRAMVMAERQRARL
jgi:transposase